MPRAPRHVLSASYVHVVSHDARERPVFLRPSDYRAFLAALGEELAREPVRLLAYCILPGRWHLVLGPGHPDALASLLQRVTGTHAGLRHAHEGTGSHGTVYQGAVHVCAIDSSAQLVRLCRDVERSALDAGLVRRAQDWPWGSLSERLWLHSRVPLASTPFLASQAWIDHVNAGEPPRRSPAGLQPRATTMPRRQAGSPASRRAAMTASA